MSLLERHRTGSEATATLPQVEVADMFEYVIHKYLNVRLVERR